MVSAPDVTFTPRVDARPLLEGLEAALVAIEPTPIWDDLIAVHGPTLVDAANDVVEAAARLEAEIGGAW